MRTCKASPGISKTQKLTQAVKAKDFTLSQGNLDGKKLAKTLGATACTLAGATPVAAAELQAWADAKMARSRLAMLRGRLSVPGFADIKPLDIMEIAGVGDRFKGKTLVTGVRHRINDQGWLTDMQFGLSAEWFSAGRISAPRRRPACCRRLTVFRSALSMPSRKIPTSNSGSGSCCR